jgi:hypothetical protein
MRYLFTNEILDAVLSATNGSSNYPVRNIQDRFLHRRFQNTTGASVITIAWLADISANCLFYAFHDLTVLSAVYKNSAGATLATITPSTINDVGVEYFTELTTVRSIEITITGNYLGGLATGVYYQMPDPLFDFSRPLIDNSYVSQNPSGQVLANYEEPLKAPAFSFRDLLTSIANDIRSEYITLGKGTPFYADFFESNRDFYSPLYCFFTNEPGDQKNGRRIDYTISLREAR